MDIINDEFQRKHFGFVNVTAERFYHSQWTKNRLAFLIYRVLIFSYSLAWAIVYFTEIYSLGMTNFWIFLTSWSEVTGCVYYFVSFIVVAYGFSIRNQYPVQKDLEWFHIIVWIFFLSALAVTLTTDVAYWILLSWKQPSFIVRNPVNIHEHAFNYILLLIDLFMNDIPLRILHFVYTIGYGFLYTMFTLVLWIVQLYKGVLDWETNPRGYAFLSLLITFIVMPLVHTLWHFWLYQLRVWTATACLNCKNKNNYQDVDDSVEMNDI